MEILLEEEAKPSLSRALVGKAELLTKTWSSSGLL